MRKCTRCPEECVCPHYSLCPFHRAMIPVACPCYGEKKKTKVEAIPEALPEAPPEVLPEAPPVLLRCDAVEPEEEEEAPAPVVPPSSPVDPEELPEFSLSIVSEVFNEEVAKLKRQEEEKERQADELMKKMKADYERKMLELLEEKKRVDEMLEKQKREQEIRNKIQKNDLEIKKIKKNSLDKKRSAVFARLSNGGSSVERKSLLKDQLKRSS